MAVNRTRTRFAPIRVHRIVKHVVNDADGSFASITQPVDESGRNILTCQFGADCLAATMDDNRLHPSTSHKHDVLQDTACDLRHFHRRTAKLHQHNRIVKSLDVRQCLNQDIRFRYVFLHP
jgi:hypothetical protein